MWALGAPDIVLPPGGLTAIGLFLFFEGAG
jgi:hypothetical protein